MSFSTTFFLFSVVTIVAGAYFLSIGLRGAIKKRAFLIPARQFMWFLFLCYTPQVLLIVRTFLSFQNGIPDTNLLFLQLLNIVILIVLVVVFHRQLNGFIVFGVNDDSFRNALILALNRLNTSFQETLSLIRIPDKGVELQIAITAWVGVAQIRIKQGQDPLFLKTLANELNQELARALHRPQMFAFIMYIVLGVALIALGILLIFIHIS